MAGVLGLDIGGANLKAAMRDDEPVSVPFALWKNPAGLVEELRAVVDGFASQDRIAVTMTGELCDCFESKRQGVHHILDAVEAVARGLPIHVWTNRGVFVTPQEARAVPLAVASANWLAQAAFAARNLPSFGSALLIDIGTTTTDIIPLLDRAPFPAARTDPERLRSGELVYRGWRRTPLCALLDNAAAELFATTLDVYLALNMHPDDPLDCDTADGQPATRDAALRRIARMICTDRETTPPGEIVSLARKAHERMRAQIAAAAHQVAGWLPGPVEWVVASGSGAFLIPYLLGAITSRSVRDFRSVIPFPTVGHDYSAAACAYAVAVLCEEGYGT
jgi:probable H4MPT-linked C1 transfer pathway protein